MAERVVVVVEEVIVQDGAGDDFAAVNEVYGQYFSQPYPARVTVEVARLPKDARVEIDAIASYD